MKGFPLIVDADMLRKFSRYELGYDELTQGRKDVVFDDYRMEIDDFYEAFKAMKKSKTSRREFLDNWFTHIYYDLYEELELGRFDSIKAIRYLTYSKDEEIVYCIVEWCRNEQEIFAINHDMTAVPDYNSIIKSIETYRANKGLQFEERKFTLSMKYAMVKRVGNPTTINDASDVTIKLYKKIKIVFRLINNTVNNHSSYIWINNVYGSTNYTKRKSQNHPKSILTNIRPNPFTHNFTLALSKNM